MARYSATFNEFANGFDLGTDADFVERGGTGEFQIRTPGWDEPVHGVGRAVRGQNHAGIFPAYNALEWRPGGTAIDEADIEILVQMGYAQDTLSPFDKYPSAEVYARASENGSNEVSCYALRVDETHVRLFKVIDDVYTELASYGAPSYFSCGGGGCFIILRWIIKSNFHQVSIAQSWGDAMIDFEELEVSDNSILTPGWVAINDPEPADDVDERRWWAEINLGTQGDSAERLHILQGSDISTTGTATGSITGYLRKAFASNLTVKGFSSSERFIPLIRKFQRDLVTSGTATGSLGRYLFKYFYRSISVVGTGSPLLVRGVIKRLISGASVIGTGTTSTVLRAWEFWKKVLSTTPKVSYEAVSTSTKYEITSSQTKYEAVWRFEGMADFCLKKGDNRPILFATLKEKDGDVVDLTNASAVQLHVGQEGQTLQIDEAATIDVDPTTGQVSYTPDGAGDTDTAGEYNVEWEVTFSGGEKITFPTEGYQTLIIEEDLD